MTAKVPAELAATAMTTLRTHGSYLANDDRDLCMAIGTAHIAESDLDDEVVELWESRLELVNKALNFYG